MADIIATSFANMFTITNQWIADHEARRYEYIGTDDFVTFANNFTDDLPATLVVPRLSQRDNGVNVNISNATIVFTAGSATFAAATDNVYSGDNAVTADWNIQDCNIVATNGAENGWGQAGNGSQNTTGDVSNNNFVAIGNGTTWFVNHQGAVNVAFAGNRFTQGVFNSSAGIAFIGGSFDGTTRTHLGGAYTFRRNNPIAGTAWTMLHGNTFAGTDYRDTAGDADDQASIYQTNINRDGVSEYSLNNRVEDQSMSAQKARPDGTRIVEFIEGYTWNPTFVDAGTAADITDVHINGFPATTRVPQAEVDFTTDPVAATDGLASATGYIIQRDAETLTLGDRVYVLDKSLNLDGTLAAGSAITVRLKSFSHLLDTTTLTQLNDIDATVANTGDAWGYQSEHAFAAASDPNVGALTLATAPTAIATMDDIYPALKRAWVQATTINESFGPSIVGASLVLDENTSIGSVTSYGLGAYVLAAGNITLNTAISTLTFDSNATTMAWNNTNVPAGLTLTNGVNTGLGAVCSNVTFGNGGTYTWPNLGQFTGSDLRTGTHTLGTLSSLLQSQTNNNVTFVNSGVCTGSRIEGTATFGTGADIDDSVIQGAFIAGNTADLDSNMFDSTATIGASSTSDDNTYIGAASFGNDSVSIIDVFANAVTFTDNATIDRAQVTGLATFGTGATSTGGIYNGGAIFGTGADISDIETTGNVTIGNGSSVDGATINSGNWTVNTPTAFTDVVINGTTTINTTATDLTEWTFSEEGGGFLTIASPSTSTISITQAQATTLGVTNGQTVGNVTFNVAVVHDARTFTIESTLPGKYVISTDGVIGTVQSKAAGAALVIINTTNETSTAYKVWWKPTSTQSGNDNPDVYDYTYGEWNPTTLQVDGTTVGANASIGDFQPDPGQVITNQATQTGVITFTPAASLNASNEAVFTITSAAASYTAAESQTFAWEIANTDLYLLAVATGDKTNVSDDRILTFGSGSVSVYSGDIIRLDATQQKILGAAQGFLSTALGAVMAVISADIIIQTATLAQVAAVAGGDALNNIIENQEVIADSLNSVPLTLTKTNKSTFNDTANTSEETILPNVT